MINIVRSTVTGSDDGAEIGPEDDVVSVEDSTVTGDDDGLALASGDDTATVVGSNVAGAGSDGVDCGSGNDTVTVEDSTINGNNASIDGSLGNDLITLKTGANIPELIDCGEDFDTIMFAMDVPEEAVGAISSQILQAGLPNGSITINGLFYEWENCELLVPQLNGVPVVRPIPTLSEWGLIAMAGILGIVGLLYIRRRSVTA